MAVPLSYTIKRWLHLSSRYRRPSTAITREQVAEILERHEVCQMPGKTGAGVVERVFSNHLAANRPCEDSHSQTIAATNDSHCLFLVCDGHGGVSCARSVSRRLPIYTAAALQTHQQLQRHLSALHEGSESMYSLVRELPSVSTSHGIKGREQRFVEDVETELLELEQRSYMRYVRRLLDSGAASLSDSNNNNNQTARALSTAFTSLDSDIGAEAVSAYNNSSSESRDTTATASAVPMATARSGCVAVAALVSASGRLHVANAGDCRAILGVRGEKGRWLARPMTRLHTVDNQDEVRRVCDAHPSSESRGRGARLLLNDRLLGLLMPLRAFGDFGFKWSRQLQQRLAKLDCEDMRQGGDVVEVYKGLLTPPYLTAQPEVISQQLTPRDRFLVLASDGVWDRLDPNDVITLIGGHLTNPNPRPNQQPSPLTFPPTGGAVVNTWRLDQLAHTLEQQQRNLLPTLSTTASTNSNTATHVLRHALAGCSQLSSLEQLEERLMRELCVPKHLARQYRDDMTVTVVVFNAELLRAR